MRNDIKWMVNYVRVALGMFKEGALMVLPLVILIAILGLVVHLVIGLF